jgi:hypothetical protein
MTLGLRKQHAHDHIEGQEPPPDWSDDNYAVVDDALVGRKSALAPHYEQVKRGE